MVCEQRTTENQRVTAGRVEMLTARNRWVSWWVNASETWQYDELLTWFIHLCWNAQTSAHAVSLLHQRYIKELRTA